MPNANPYAAPLPPATKAVSSEPHWRRARSISGAIFLVALLAGVAFTAVGMTRTFNAIATTENVDPAELAQHISFSLSTGMITTPITVVALSVWIFATIKIWRFRAANSQQSH
jgi:hypothetical protein